MRWLTSLTRWLNPGPRQRPDLHVVLFTRAHCPLCDDAALLLEQFRARYGFTLEARDVDASPELTAAHGNWVPVVTIDGRLRFRGQVNPVLLQRILDVS